MTKPDVHTEVLLKSANTQKLVNNLQHQAELSDHSTDLIQQRDYKIIDIIHYFGLACPPFILFN